MSLCIHQTRIRDLKEVSICDLRTLHFLYTNDDRLTALHALTLRCGMLQRLAREAYGKVSVD